ncbi:hypothetical protein RJ640_028290 [Escallonia rubra]|uniref:Clp R domain-containing protein n=1 Tax=Escallonia rubra TaxID=112253 RepID=A0AA88RBW9_9ASTE|nr:hypothetical protein RJ640_028290 [Escallonia rubra]
MPTSVSTARQCLTQEAERALKEAVAVARRRCHSQTTSLHAVSALLSLPSSPLREACGRARNSAYPSRVQFKALELCLGVSLDRLPSSPQRVDEPPVSNSFMAAIKRSQANQRRQPENFQLYQQQQTTPSSSSISTVKVELQNLILAILDDPVVSRVFSEAGFRSCDVKMGILRPVHQLLQYSRYKGPPMFLCNLNSDQGPGPGRGRGAFSFPFLGCTGVLDGDENFNKIGEILVRKKGRNPLLVGENALDTLRNFLEIVQKRGRGGLYPAELAGLGVICIENEVMRFVTEKYDENLVKLRFEEVGGVVESCVGPGVVINFGDLKVLVGEGVHVGGVSHVVRELARLLELHGGKVWLVGAAAKYETFLRILNRFPSLDKDWDLHLLPITSPRPPMAETYPRSRQSMPIPYSGSSIVYSSLHSLSHYVADSLLFSVMTVQNLIECAQNNLWQLQPKVSRFLLMESFVPFGGLFSTSSGMTSLLDNSTQCASRCHLCSDRCKREVNALLNGGFTASVADQFQFSLPSWLQMDEPSTIKGLDVVKAKDDSMVMSAKATGLEKKWDSICQRLHYTQQLPKADTYCVGCKVPTVVGFQVAEDRKGNASDNSCNNTNASSTQSMKNIIACTAVSLHQNYTPKQRTSSAEISKSMNVNFGSKLCQKASKVEDDLGGLGSPPCSLSGSSVDDGRTSPASATSVTTDLGLGIHFASLSRELDKPTNQSVIDLLQDFSDSSPAKDDVVTQSIISHTAKFGLEDFKAIYTPLTKRIGRQEEALSVISQTVARCRTGNEKRRGTSRRDTWFSFLGPDTLCMKKTAIALAEIIYGSQECFIYVDLNFQHGSINPNTVCNRRERNGSDFIFRGKTIVDYIAEELCKRPLSVVFLENIDKADPLARNSLSKAVRTGKFSDSYGREFGIGNTIFITTSRCTGNNILYARENARYSEENVSRAKGWPIQMLVGFDLGDNVISRDSRMLDITRKGDLNPIPLSKRKLTGTTETPQQHQTLEMAKRAYKASNMSLDLNLPAEDIEISNANWDTETVSEDSEAWMMDDFIGQLDQTVVFKPFDFDALADKMLQKITECFHQIVGLEGLLEIDSKVMEQILAAVCLSGDSTVEDWIEQVLGRAFVEAQKRYNLSLRSVVKLVTCEGLLPEEQAPGVFLPGRIIVT